MRILATARLNKQYKWWRNFNDTIIQAYLTDGGQVRFQEIYHGKIRALPEELVMELFPAEGLLRDRPFLSEENMDFYAILHRRRKRYQERFARLIRPPVILMRRG